ncbi:MFS transporter [Georgenia sp. SYP-B2076]|uniref:MFS transporter n=1 Tax=Georgenia sp. SYP-B2076 TaxID=2495881 RepID=UPI000F8ED1F4|nr:MFS transporter [Georgenia sp. SYP-B2076]
MTIPPRARRALPSGLLLVGILLVAANLRPVITAVGPLLPEIGADTGLPPSALGILAAVPLVAFGVVSPVVHRLGSRFGVERTVLLALVLLAAGTVLRSLPGATLTLWVGTALIGATIAVGNVLLPVVVKKDFPTHLTGVTAGYTAVQSVFASLASGLAVPLAAASWGSWRLALGVWAGLMVAAVAVWVPRLLHPAPAAEGLPATRPHRATGSIWRSGLAWQVAAYMGLQSTVFYVLVNWLPTLEQDLGVDPTTAGWHLFAFQAVAIVSNLAAPSLMRVGGDQRVAAALFPTLTLAAMLGLLLAPQLLLVWVILIGIGTGGAFVTALSLVGLRAADTATASRLSSMSQAVGYLGAALNLVLAGVLRDHTGPGPLLLVCVAAVAVVQLVVGLGVGRGRVLHA